MTIPHRTLLIIAVALALLASPVFAQRGTKSPAELPTPTRTTVALETATASPTPTVTVDGDQVTATPTAEPTATPEGTPEATETPEPFNPEPWPTGTIEPSK